MSPSFKNSTFRIPPTDDGSSCDTEIDADNYDDFDNDGEEIHYPSSIPASHHDDTDFSQPATENDPEASQPASLVGNSSSRYQNRESYQSFPISGDYMDPIKTSNRKTGSKCKTCGKLFITHANCRLFEHLINKCTIPDDDKRHLEQIWNRNPPSQEGYEQRFVQLLTKVILKNNLPLRLVECELFRKLCKMHPPTRFPGRHLLSKFYIPRISKLLDEKFFKEVGDGPNYTLSIEFDHWTDLTHRSLLAVLATKADGSKHLLDVEDVSLTGHSAESIIRTLNRVLAPIEPLKINSIVSDAAASCSKARADFVQQAGYKHVIHQRCIAHLLNLVGKDISEHRDVLDIMQQATKLVSIISTDTRIVAEFDKAGQRHRARSVKTRWYSIVNMLESLVSCRDLAIRAISEAIEKSRTAPNPDRVACLEALQSELFGPDLTTLLAIYRPLANCIAIAESSNCYLGEAMKAILEFARSLFESDWEVNFVIPTIEAFLTHFSVEKLTEYGLGIMLTAYCLDKRNKRNYLTKNGAVLVLETLCKVASGMGYTTNLLGKQLEDDFEAYWFQEQPYRRKAEPNETAENWWQKQPSFGVLKAIALRIVSLKSSSANIERLFSIVKTFQAPNRTRTALSTLTRIAPARVANDWSDFAEEDQLDEDIPLVSTRRTSTARNSTPDQNLLSGCSVDLESGSQAFRRNLQSSHLGAMDTDAEESSAASIVSSASDAEQSVAIYSLKKARHHIPKKLSSRKLKKSYKQFFKLFDSAIVNEDIIGPQNVQGECSSGDWRVALNKFMSALKSRKK